MYVITSPSLVGHAPIARRPRLQMVPPSTGTPSQ
jgi:hypothetical protein